MKKVIFSSKALLGVMKLLKPVINTSTVLPILEDILITYNHATKKLTLGVTNLEIVMTSTLDVEGKEDFMCLVSFSLLFDLVSTCQEQPVVLTYFEGNLKAEFKGEDFTVKMVCDDPKNYPVFPKGFDDDTVDTLYKLKLDAKSVQTYFGKAVKFVSNDDLRPSMTGVYLHHDKQGFNVVATDAHMLYFDVLTCLGDTSKVDIILPQHAVRTIVNTFKKDNISFFGNATHACFKNDRYTIITRTIDARFPDYKAVLKPIQEGATQKFVMFRKQLMYLLKMAGKFSNKSTNQTAFTLQEHKLVLESGDIDFDFSFAGSMPVYEAANVTGKDQQIAFNSVFMQRALSQYTDDYVKIMIWSATKGAIVDDNILIMPLMLNT